MRICLVLGPHAAVATHPERVRYVREAATALAAAGHVVDVLGEDATFRTGLTLPRAMTTHRVDAPDGTEAAYPRPIFAYAMRVRRTLERLHAPRAFDAVEFSTGLGEGYFLVRAKRTLGVLAGVVVAARAWTPDAVKRSATLDERLGFDQAVHDHAQRSVLREADLVTTTTAALLNTIAPLIEQGSLWGSPVREAVGTPMPAPVAAAPAAGATTETFSLRRVVFTGPLEHARGSLLLARAAALAEPAFGLAFLGPDTSTGPYARPARPLIERAAGTRIAVTFDDAGKPEPDDLVCVPSRADEPEDALLAEALAGRAVLVGDSAGMREAFGPAACLPGEEAPLADALASLLRDPARVDAVRAAARERAIALTDPAEFARRFEQGVQRAKARAVDVPQAVVATSRSGITAVIPVFNLGAFLPATLAAVQAQTLAPDRIIVVDDGSTDEKTIDVLRQIERDGVTVLRKPNAGVGSARNLGVREARTDLVAIIDADDLPEPEFFARAADVLRSTPRLSYASALPLMFEGDPAAGKPGWIPLGLPGIDEDLLLCRNSGGLGGCTVFVRQHLLDAGGYDETLPSYEDWELWCRLAGRGRAGVVLPEFLCRYRVHPGSKHATVGLPLHDRLKSFIMARHGRPPLLSERTLRFEAGEGAATRAEMRSLAERAEAEGKKIEELTGELDRSAQWNRELQARADELAATVDSSAAWARTLQERSESLAAELAQSAAWNLELQTRANALGIKLEEAAAWGRLLDQRVGELCGELAKSAEWNRAQQAMIEARDAEVEELRARLTSAESRLAGATDHNVYIAQQLSAAVVQRATADGRAAQAEARAAELERALAAIDRAADAQALVRSNIRYRAADAVNDALKKLHVQRAIKALMGTAGRGRNPQGTTH